MFYECLDKETITPKQDALLARRQKIWNPASLSHFRQTLLKVNKMTTGEVNSSLQFIDPKLRKLQVSTIRISSVRG